MSVARLLTELNSAGVRLQLVDGAIRCDGPPGARAKYIEPIRQNKSDLLRFLTLQGSVIFVDFETRSLAKLKGPNAVTGRVYAMHPSTEIICAALRMPGGQIAEWVPGDTEPTGLRDLVSCGVPVCAHNATGFDSHIWQKANWPKPQRWIDTIQLAKMAGYPEGKRGLDALGEELLGKNKDTEGSKLTLSLSKPNRKTKQLPAIDNATRARVITYCRSDVELLAGIYARLAKLDGVESTVRDVDRVINDRGFLLDKDLARAVIELDEMSVQQAQANAGVTPDVLASYQKLKAHLSGLGVHVEDVQEATLRRVLSTDISDAARRVIEARLCSAPVAAKKLRTALKRVGADGRIRDSLMYCGAHTWRWAGRGFQPQNLNRQADINIDNAVSAALSRDMESLRAIAKEAGVSLEDVFASLVRPCIIAPDGKILGVVDYGQIEARALAWLAGDDDDLKIFSTGLDPYKVMAASLFAVAYDDVSAEQRKLGKVCVLGCGYQMGYDRFAAQAEDNGVDWTTSTVTPEQAVEAWRDAHPLIAGIKTESSTGKTYRTGGLWQALENAAKRAARGERIAIGHVYFYRNGSSVVCMLPSGRPLIYQHAHIAKHPKYNKPSFCYTNSRGKVEFSYGGKLAENITQSVCRDILAEALVNLESADFDTVLHVHDEAVDELDSEGELERMRDIMTTVPSWARGLPLAAEGFTAQRYRK